MMIDNRHYCEQLDRTGERNCVMASCYNGRILMVQIYRLDDLSPSRRRYYAGRDWPWQEAATKARQAIAKAAAK